MDGQNWFGHPPSIGERPGGCGFHKLETFTFMQADPVPGID
jgi:hypothetical protein